MHDLEHLKLSSLGGFYPLSIKFDEDLLLSQLEKFEQHWKPYNPRKSGNNRFGLSLYSLDGSMAGIPDLDSVSEYNQVHGTQYTESDFCKPTRAWNEMTELSERVSGLSSYLGRSHFIKLTKGGFFPPHRDLGDCFRLVSIFKKVPGSFHFIHDESTISFTPGYLYFLDTRKVHSVFNYEDDLVMLVLNVAFHEKSIQFVKDNLEAK